MLEAFDRCPGGPGRAVVEQLPYGRRARVCRRADVDLLLGHGPTPGRARWGSCRRRARLDAWPGTITRNVSTPRVTAALTGGLARMFRNRGEPSDEPSQKVTAEEEAVDRGDPGLASRGDGRRSRTCTPANSALTSAASSRASSPEIRAQVRPAACVAGVKQLPARARSSPSVSNIASRGWRTRVKLPSRRRPTQCGGVSYLRGTQKGGGHAEIGVASARNANRRASAALSLRAPRR